MKTETISIPRPPAGLADFGTGSRYVPGPEIDAFVKAALLDEKHELYNADHDHLAAATIGYLWTNEPNRRNMKRIAGQAEIPQYNLNRWQKGRLMQQLTEWFGPIPDFVITLDADYVNECDDVAFLALLEHELYHCGQAVDAFGFPKFSRDSGRPIYAIRGHDIEEFTGVVRRYGIQAAGADMADFVRAANEIPAFGPASIAALCGSCH